MTDIQSQLFGMVCKLHLQSLQRLNETMLKVLTVLQQALCVVKGFPDKADIARALETLAECAGSLQAFC